MLSPQRGGFKTGKNGRKMERTCELFRPVGGRSSRELEQAEREFAEYGIWQDAYKDARDSGKDDNACREYANSIRYNRAA